MKKLLAYMNTEYVGELIKLSNGAHQFTYSEQRLFSPRGRPISLSLQLRKNTYTSDKVINYFDNLLPDSPFIRQQVVARYEAESAQPFDLLKKLGEIVLVH